MNGSPDDTHNVQNSSHVVSDESIAVEFDPEGEQSVAETVYWTDPFAGMGQGYLICIRTHDGGDFRNRRLLQIYENFLIVRYNGDNERYHFDEILSTDPETTADPEEQDWGLAQNNRTMSDDATTTTRNAAPAPCVCIDGTGYRKKRRLLREHRRNMRVMDELIQDNGLSSDLEERLEEKTGHTNFWLGVCKDMDEDSDCPDPEVLANNTIRDLRGELQDRERFIQTISGAIEYRKTVYDLEHARMQLEDLRSQALRAD